MKKISTVISLMVLTCLMGFKGDKSSVDWYKWNKGYSKGIENNKKVILVDVYTDWCGWCKKMDKTTYSDEDVVKLIDKHFVPIKFNPEDKNTYKIDGHKVNGKELLGILAQNKKIGYPTTFFLFPKKREIQKVSGYVRPKKFEKTLKKIVAYKKKIQKQRSN